MNIEGITWHAVVVSEEQRAALKALLGGVMGLRVAAEAEGFTRFAMGNGTVLELYGPESVPGYGYNEGGVAFGFRVDDIEAASRELAAAGCELLGEIRRMRRINYAYREFRGPDGRVYGLNEQRS
jgi:glyoxalase/bleomycin resistance protein/dioxygenase superfamily protein